MIAKGIRLSLTRVLFSGALGLTSLALYAADVPSEALNAEALAALWAGKPALVFTETREAPIRGVEGFQARWGSQLKAGAVAFRGEAHPGEFLTFQVGIYSLTNLGPVRIVFGDLRGASGGIPATALRCLSLGGIGQDGVPFTKHLEVNAGDLQTLWIGVDVPQTALGLFSGAAQLHLGEMVTVPVKIQISVDGAPKLDHGDSSGKDLSRLRWLDSNAGAEPSITYPFTPVRTARRTVFVLGRELVLGEDGLPARVASHFSPANTRVEQAGRDVLGAPMAFIVETSAGEVKWRNEFQSLSHSEIEATWSARSLSDSLETRITGRLDYTGSGQVRIRLSAHRDAKIIDARLEALWREDAATYFMGLNHPGGKRPIEPVRWKWDVNRQQDCFWLGDVNAGMMLRFKGTNFVRPLVNIYYHFRPLNLPESWGNEGRGGIDIAAAHDGVVPIRVYSGQRTLRAGQSLDFVFDFYLTPFRTLDTEKQWSVRFDQSHDTEKVVAESNPKEGPNVVNIHQGTFFNPYINYPYGDESFPALSNLIHRAHQKGMRVRVYYTTRELTVNMPEFFPLFSMNGEVVFPGPGADARTLLHPNGPDPWLTANLGTNFIPAWTSKVGGKYAAMDYSVITRPDSRWNNFYLAGLKWMCDTADLDGIYIDDSALNARSLRRARRILDQRPDRLVDLHSWNHFNPYAGYASSLMLYMEILPYLDSLWLGEGFNCNTVTPDFWLVEMSGLPFGLMSQMLEGANPSRGMVFGETGRLGWSDDPRQMWKVWDKYGIQGTEFLPFFMKDCPVTTGNPHVLATVYRRPGRSFVALGSWDPHETQVKLNVDWKALGLSETNTVFHAPNIPGTQPERIWAPSAPIPVSPGHGWFLVLEGGRNGD